MAGITGTFDARQFKPMQAMDKHPIGKYPFTISNTTIDPTKDQTGGMFTVEFTTPAGAIVHRYNLWNSNPKAVEIAHSQLSALCHATGVFQLDFSNEGAALRNARGTLEVGFQKGEAPTPEKPDGGYVEVKRVMDAAGNEPGRAPSPPAQGWGGNQQQPAQAQPQQGWQQGTAQAAPPWANK